ncbi:hypothetical protein RYX56_08470 [Alkalihalophilus lindianensis]|uniref:Penicillin-binding protein-related factor A, recombinase n=1 Tax=Alkalihalophilus lindianensis TaxID=1630542 RepID=A0ABU3X9C6_9BACI|nr:hypothetical protein [Alkalihalophilus lindianensis]MDV2684403.1 hypothetical protein [Alkalihalophilus lindianensis]
MNFQRENSISNAHVGRDFEEVALDYFKGNNILLDRGVCLPVGVSKLKKNRNFDLGCISSDSKKMIVECKSHKWTSSGKVPSAKMTVWNEAMYYFFLASQGYRKVFFILKDYNEKRGETLGEYYIRTYKHLIPEDVEIMEYDSQLNEVRELKAFIDGDD